MLKFVIVTIDSTERVSFDEKQDKGKVVKISSSYAIGKKKKVCVFLVTRKSQTWLVNHKQLKSKNRKR